MRQLKFKLILPILQVLLAVILLHGALQTRLPKGLDTPYGSTAGMICDAINAPAVLLSNLKIFLPPNWRDGAAWSVFGFHFDPLLFLLCVVILWFLVGHELDRRRVARPVMPKSLTTGEIVFNLVAVLWGVLLTAFSIANYSHLQDLARWNNAVGNIIEGTFFWGWSLILIIFPGLTLMSGVRNKHRAPATPS